MSKGSIHIHLKSRQSVTCAKNQTCLWVMFLRIFNIDVKSVIFNEGTFTSIYSVQDERIQ